MSSSNYAGSGNKSANHQPIRMDVENNGQQERARRPRHVVRLWKIPLPLRRAHMVSDLFKNVACLMTLLCIVQYIYIRHLRDGLTRIPNDPYDNTFARVIDRNSPLIWDRDRQLFIHNTFPVPVHSHNDYSRRIPLFEALGSGCISVEADVHLRDSDLLIGHTAVNLQKDSTLRSMYLEPLQRMLVAQNVNVTSGTWKGLFNHAPQQTFVLLVDHKSSGPETFAELYAQLQPLRDLDYLTYWNGTERVMRPLTIVASGNAPFESVVGLDTNHRDIFWDAKLERLVSINDDFSVDPIVYAYNRSNSYFASTEFTNGRFHAYSYGDTSHTSHRANSRTKDIAASQIEQANSRGLVTRYWNTPTHPPNIQEIAWRFLVDKQVGVLNMDDLGTVRARARGWGSIRE